MLSRLNNGICQKKNRHALKADRNITRTRVAVIKRIVILTRMPNIMGFHGSVARKEKATYIILRKSCSLTSVCWGNQSFSAIKYRPTNHSPSPKIQGFAWRQQQSVSVYSQMFYCYSRTTPDWAQNSEERWTACICKEGKKMDWRYSACIL